jgi:hypothetical protein
MNAQSNWEALDACAPFDFMKFTLTFDGDLRASGNSPKPKDKWNIRHAFHPQLVELWAKHPSLRNLRAIAPKSADSGFMVLETHHDSTYPVKPLDEHERDLFAPIDVGSHRFKPLIRQSMALVCDLEILFLRKEEPGSLVMPGGDLDNRIKTLFDGLRMPKADEMCFNSEPIDDPFCCLLEDDALITDFRVRTGQLFSGLSNSQCQVRLVVDVTVKVTHVRPYNLRLIG